MPNSIPDLRLLSQHISAGHHKKPQDVVSWMGAMQAQDFSMVRWAIAVRMSSASWSSVQKAIDKGDIIRTHLLRPTWHLASVKDVSWMLDLSVPQIKAAAKSRLGELELTPSILRKSVSVFSKVLEDGHHLTRDQMLVALEKHKINVGGQRASYILLWAELEKAICSGPMMANKNTYAFFDDRVKDQKKIPREEALAKLAMRYFTSRGPATLDDFMNWSALPRSDARKAVEAVRDKFVEEKIDSKVYLFKDGDTGSNERQPSVFLLPAFDEFIIGYKDRSAVLQQKHKGQVISVNGIFGPVIVVNGQVVGLWKRTITKHGTTVALNYFPRSGAKTMPN